MPDSDLALLIAASQTAGAIAMRHFRRDVAVEKKADDSPVTEADLASNAFLERRLRGARPDYGWLSEESPDDTDRLARKRVFVVDPIDGTRAFIAGGASWGVALAVVEDGQAHAGVFHMPVQDKTYWATVGGGAWLNGHPLRTGTRAELSGAQVLATKAGLASDNWDTPLPPVAIHYRPSLVLRLCLVAEGRFDATITLRDSADWDIAAGALMCLEAGARVTDRAGGPVVLNRERPCTAGLFAANSTLHSEFCRHAVREPRAAV
ncbi:MAG: 3'(2'),5'-bisphosphate nucleotidase CysQ [Pseudomonadota bacterium]